MFTSVTLITTLPVHTKKRGYLKYGLTINGSYTGDPLKVHSFFVVTKLYWAIFGLTNYVLIKLSKLALDDNYKSIVLLGQSRSCSLLAAYLFITFFLVSLLSSPNPIPDPISCSLHFFNTKMAKPRKGKTTVF